MEMPMLDEDEFQSVQSVYRECTAATKEFRERWNMPLTGVNLEVRFAPMLLRYEELTGMKEANYNAVRHHRLSLYGLTLRELRKAFADAEGEALCKLHGSGSLMSRKRAAPRDMPLVKFL